MINTIMYVLPGLVEVTLLFILVDSCFERKYKVKNICISWIVIDFTILIISKSINSSFNFILPINLLSEVFLMKGLFRCKIPQAVFLLTCFSSIVGICDILICIIVITVFHTNLDYILNIPIVNNTGAITSKLLLLVAIMRLKIFIKKIDHKSFHYFEPLLLVPVVSICAMLLIIDYSMNVVTSGGRTILVYVTVLGLFIMNILVFVIYERLYEMSRIKQEVCLMEQQLVYQHKYFEQLERSNEEVRAIKHDIHRHINLIHTLASSGEHEKLLEYTEEICNSTKKVMKVVQTGNLILDSIINEKFTAAVNLGIEMKFMVEEMKFTMIQPTSLCIIVSNVLDNAIEGCEKVNLLSEKALIELKLYHQKNNLIFSVTNDALEPVEDKGIFITSKKNKKEHGIGLKNVKKVIEANNGQFELGYVEGKFIFVCRIPLNGQKLHEID